MNFSLCFEFQLFQFVSDFVFLILTYVYGVITNMINPSECAGVFTKKATKVYLRADSEFLHSLFSSLATMYFIRYA